MVAEKKKAKIRADYELGNYSSVDELAKKVQVSARTIHGWIDNESWVKGEKKGLLQKSIQQRFIEALAAEKCDVVYLAKKVKELMEATDAILDKDGKPVMGCDKDGKPKIEVKNWPAIAKGLQEANKILGSYAPVQHEVEHKFTVVVRRVLDLVQAYVPVKVRETADYQNAVTAIFQEVGE